MRLKRRGQIWGRAEEEGFLLNMGVCAEKRPPFTPVFAEKSHVSSRLSKKADAQFLFAHCVSVL